MQEMMSGKRRSENEMVLSAIEKRRILHLKNDKWKRNNLEFKISFEVFAFLL